MFTKPENPVSESTSMNKADSAAPASCHGIMRVLRPAVTAAAAVLLVLIFTSETDMLITGRSCLTYPMGSSMVNYAAGFVRRGLYGEILMLMNAVCQPFIAMLLISAISLIFIVYMLISRMARLGIGLPFILAVLFSPSLILMQRDTNFLRSDCLVIALNLTASCILLHLLFRKRQSAMSHAGMLGIDAVIFSLLLLSALIHELSASLLPPVLLLFFLYCRRGRKIRHFVLAIVTLAAVYAVMMTHFKYSDVGIIADSWAGVYSDSSSLRLNPGLVNVVDQSMAMMHVHMSLDQIRQQGFSLFSNMLIAVALPFAFLMLSGITVFRSASSRARKIRIVLIAACLGPLGLCLAGIDFGRWFSICAINLAVHTLLIAHASGRRWFESFPQNFRRLTFWWCRAAVLAAALVLLSYRLHTFGFFVRTGGSAWQQTVQMAANVSHLPEDIKPLLSREKIIQKSGC